MKSKIYLLLGSNLESRIDFLRKAEKKISEKIGKIFKKSSVYESKSWGFESEQIFLNQVVLVETSLKPIQLLETTQAIEKQIGRIEKTHNQGYKDRKIDIDILFYDDLIIKTKNLIIPHCLLHERRFTLLPMCEIAKNYNHPIFNQNIQFLLNHCKDKQFIKKF